MSTLKSSKLKALLKELSNFSREYCFAAEHGQLIYANHRLAKFLNNEGELPRVKDILTRHENGTYYLQGNKKSLMVDVKHHLSNIEEKKTSLYVCQDISKYLKNQRSMEKRCDEYEFFSYRVAHDLKGPLSAAKQYLSVVNKKDFDAEMVTETLDKSISIIQSLYVFSGLSQHTDFQEVDLDSIVPSLEDMMPEFPAYKLKSHLTFFGSPTITMTLLQNLFKNTIDHFHNKGTPQVRLTTTATAHDLVIVTFEDNGPGIPSDKISSIQKAFHKGKESEGLGLGMNIIKKAVELQHGKMKISSSKDLGGVKIEMTFPARGPESL